MNSNSVAHGTSSQYAHAPNLVSISRTPLDDEPPLPDAILNIDNEDVSSEVTLEWVPTQPWESLTGILMRKTAMTHGGTAYVFDMRSLEEINDADSDPRLVLLKKGGRILDTYMRHIEIGDFVYVRYRGELPAKPGQNPARDWRLVKARV